MTERPSEFVVRRKTWQRGQSPSLLRDDRGKQCCLGFVCEQLGVEHEAMQCVGTPGELVWAGTGSIDPSDYPQLMGVVVRDSTTALGHLVDSDLSSEAMSINDDDAITDAVREAQLTKLFKRYGYALRFEP